MVLIVFTWFKWAQ